MFILLVSPYEDPCSSPAAILDAPSLHQQGKGSTLLVLINQHSQAELANFPARNLQQG